MKYCNYLRNQQACYPGLLLGTNLVFLPQILTQNICPPNSISTYHPKQNICRSQNLSRRSWEQFFDKSDVAHQEVVPAGYMNSEFYFEFIKSLRQKQVDPASQQSTLQHLPHSGALRLYSKFFICIQSRNSIKCDRESRSHSHTKRGLPQVLLAMA